jgi:hypothetical protein
MEFNNFLAMNFLRWVTVASDEHRMNFRFSSLFRFEAVSEDLNSSKMFTCK